MLNAIYRDVSFARVQLVDITRQRNYLHAIEKFIGNVVADNHRRALFFDLTTDRWIEIDPPHLTALHRQRLQSWLQPTQAPQLRVLHLEPSVDKLLLDPLQGRAGARGLR